jgi:hypothetical protein
MNDDKKTLLDLLLERAETSRNSLSNDLAKFALERELSENEVSLRKYGLKDENGEFTRIAIDLVFDKVVNDHETYLLALISGKENKDKESTDKK